jgi:hypothetical protein
MPKQIIQTVLCALTVSLTPFAVHAQAQDAADAGAKFTFDGEAALWTVAIKPDKAADFEGVLTRLREALTTSTNPDRRRQAEGWTVLRLSTPLPDGNIAYVHDVRPVVPNADYSVMRILYEAYPKESRELYESYRGAFVKNVALATGAVAMQMRPPAQAVSPSQSAPSPETPASPVVPSSDPSPNAAAPSPQ